MKLRFFIKAGIHFVCLAFLVVQYYQTISDTGIADPVKQIIHFTGIGALNLLLITLMMTPLARWLKNPLPIQLRRLLGLYCFFYALLHLLNFAAFELGFQLSLLYQELLERPYIWVGAIAFIILFSLAVTSTHGLKRKLGKRWQSLHNLIYLAAPLIWLHFFWSRKADLLEPGLYLACIILLLAMRKTKLIRIIKSAKV